MTDPTTDTTGTQASLPSIRELFATYTDQFAPKIVSFVQAELSGLPHTLTVLLEDGRQFVDQVFVKNGISLDTLVEGATAVLSQHASGNPVVEEVKAAVDTAEQAVDTATGENAEEAPADPSAPAPANA